MKKAEYFIKKLRTLIMSDKHISLINLLKNSITALILKPQKALMRK
nr:hypothetical protein [Providencia sp. M-8]